MSIVIGIDLGTSTTEAAVYRGGKKEMLLNLEGTAVTPSAVGIDERGNWVVGERARAQYLLSPENTAIEVKRKTGSGQTVQLGRGRYQPQELQSRLLSYVRTYASEYLGESVERAVISVPAYFNELQRRETIRAGELAGFSVERILNEPTAAALSYGLEHMDEESHVLVYDLGGGTFDVTLLEMFDGVLEVKASSGDNQLGGKDFDEALMDWLFRRFQEQHGKDLRKDRYAAAKVKEEAERCKIALSREERYHILIPAISTLGGGPVELEETVTRAQFEELTRELLERTHHPIDVVLQDAEISEREIDRVILVGGSTSMPMVRADIADYLGIEPECAVNPEYAVAEGAAVQAAIITGEIDAEDGLILTDVNPYTLGISTADDGFGDCMSVVIPRNVTIPVTREKEYCTFWDDQTCVSVEVYQGESSIASHNHFLGSFLIEGIPPGPAGREKLNVQFAYDLNGLLKVSATIRATGKSASIQIHMTGEPEEEAKPEVDYSQWKKAPGARAYRTLIRTAERWLAKEDDPRLTRQLRDELRATLVELKKALVLEDEESAEDLRAQVEDILDIVRTGQ